MRAVVYVCASFVKACFQMPGFCVLSMSPRRWGAWQQYGLRKLCPGMFSNTSVMCVADASDPVRSLAGICVSRRPRSCGADAQPAMELRRSAFRMSYILCEKRTVAFAREPKIRVVLQ